MIYGVFRLYFYVCNNINMDMFCLSNGYCFAFSVDKLWGERVSSFITNHSQ